jgi:hypothetical protein
VGNALNRREMRNAFKFQLEKLKGRGYERAIGC